MLLFLVVSAKTGWPYNWNDDIFAGSYNIKITKEQAKLRNKGHSVESLSTREYETGETLVSYMFNTINSYIKLVDNVLLGFNVILELIR